ncbi:MAG: hypothetical protein AAB431_02720, partial [Patescibacteria group bacterium]
MLSKIPFHSNIFQGLFIAIFLLNVFLFHSAILGVILLIAFLGVNADKVGLLIFRQQPAASRWWLGCLVLLSSLLILLTIAY